ncbi:MAG TPA: hypothetical protein VFV02_14180 [Acidimicrobiales bacterium]|nr:hypothetical protein [Acidimicrobiales bacterium]
MTISHGYPILSQQRFIPGKVRHAPVDADIVQVLVRRGGVYLCAAERSKDGWPMSAIQWILGAPWRRYNVHTSENLLQFESIVPCKNDAGYFDARIAVQWKVSNPVAFVKRQSPNVHDDLESWINHRIRRIVDRFEPTQRLAAEAAIRTAFIENPEALGVPGVRISHCDIMLTPDAATVAHLASLTAIRRERELDEQRQALWDHRREYYRAVVGAGFFEAVIFELSYKPDEVTAIRNVLFGRERLTQSRSDSGSNGMGKESYDEDFEMIVARERSAVDHSLFEDHTKGFHDFSAGDDPAAGVGKLASNGTDLGDEGQGGSQGDVPPVS